MDLLKSDVCRTCMFKNENLLSIFDIHISDSDAIQIAQFLINITSIEITKGDGLSQKLCLSCIETICKVYDFVQMCRNSDSLLRSHNAEQVNNSTNDCSNLTLAPKSEENIIFEAQELREIQNIVSDDVATNLVNDEEKTNGRKETPTSKYRKCEKIFGSKVEFEDQKKYQCKECSMYFIKKTELNKHMQVHNIGQAKHVCEVCGKAFTYSYLLKQHSFKHTEEKPFPCTKCKKGCLTAESLRRHMTIHEDGYKAKIHTCNVCGKEFRYPSFVSEHMKTHTGEKPFLCSVCGKGFRQKGALEYHFRSHTGYKPYKCEICQKTFTCRGVLRVHKRQHTDERPYICDICGVGFRQLTDMKRHQSVHSGDKHALCTICGKQMSTTGQLTIHLRSHTGEKPFGCEVCQKAFTTRTMLVKHQRIHTGERPYTCKICGRSFNQSSSLKTHGMVHTKNTVLHTSKSLTTKSDTTISHENRTKIEAYLTTPL